MNLLSNILAIFVGAAVIQSAAAQPAGNGGDQKAPYASHGGTVRVLPEKAIDPAEDPLNAFAEEQTVDGLVVSFTIDGETITLDSAVVARVPLMAANREGKDLEGDMVFVTGYAGERVVAKAAVPDVLRNAQEGEGLVLTTRRQLSVVLAADTPIDKVEIEAPATDARASLYTGGAYGWFCEAGAQNKWCLRGDNQ